MARRWLGITEGDVQSRLDGTFASKSWMEEMNSLILEKDIFRVSNDRFG